MIGVIGLDMTFTPDVFKDDDYKRDVSDLLMEKIEGKWTEPSDSDYYKYQNDAKIDKRSARILVKYDTKDIPIPSVYTYNVMTGKKDSEGNPIKARAEVRSREVIPLGPSEATPPKAGDAPLTVIPPPIAKPPIAVKASPYKDITERIYHDETSGKDVPVYTTTILKGTLLFRGISSVDQRKSDLYGIYDRHKQSYCIPPQYNVYFYPFPFMDKIVGEFRHHIVYVLTQNVEIMVLISPSPLYRAMRVKADSSRSPLISCEKIFPYGCGSTIGGKHYDACFREPFLKANPDVLGTIAVAMNDRRKFRSKGELTSLGGKYISGYTDQTSPDPAIPEIVLYPLNGRRPDFTHSPPEDPLKQIEYTKDHVYTEYYAFIQDPGSTVAATRLGSYKEFIDKLVSPVGFEAPGGRVLRAQIDKTTGFYVDPALYSGDPKNLLPSEEFDHMADSFPELRFTRTSLVEPAVAAPATGATRRRRRQ